MIASEWSTTAAWAGFDAMITIISDIPMYFELFGPWTVTDEQLFGYYIGPCSVPSTGAIQLAIGN